MSRHVAALRDAEAMLARDPVAAVAAWQARGGAPADAVGTRIVEALARRAAAQQGELRKRLEQRIIERLAALCASLDAAGPCAAEDDGAAASMPAGAALAGLSALVDRIGRWPVATAARSAPNAPAALRATTPPVRGAVSTLRGTWARLRAEQRLRLALDQVPAQAGPLNSAQLVSRALQAMHELSPDYLHAFMAHVDTLLWLDQAGHARRR